MQRIFSKLAPSLHPYCGFPTSPSIAVNIPCLQSTVFAIPQTRSIGPVLANSTLVSSSQKRRPPRRQRKSRDSGPQFSEAKPADIKPSPLTTASNPLLTRHHRILDESQHQIKGDSLPVYAWPLLIRLKLAGNIGLSNGVVQDSRSNVVTQHAGHDVFVVGGTVRDLTIGVVPKDVDLLTSAPLKQVRAYPVKPPCR